MQRNSYVTLTTSDFIVGTIALFKSLRRVTGIPMMAMCLNTTSEDRTRLLDIGISCLDVDPIENPFNGPKNSNKGRFTSTYTKLRAFGLEQFDRIVFLDSDTLVLQSIDDLFTKDGFWAAPDRGKKMNAHRFNSGVFSVQPSSPLLDRMLELVPTTISSDSSDQGFLNDFYNERWNRLDTSYNTLKRVFYYHPGSFSLSTTRVLHFVGAKPWHRDPDDENVYGRLNDFWHEIYNS